MQITNELHWRNWQASGPHGRYAAQAATGPATETAVATALLDRQLAAQAAAFEAEGGFTERLYRVRQEKRRKDK